MGLRAYIIRRILLVIPILMGTTLLIFAVTQLFNPVARASLYITNIQQFTTENINQVIEKHGLNDPAYMQFFRWLSEVLSGNLGYSRTARQPVLQALITRIPATFELVMFSAPIIILLGIYLGVKSAVHRDKPIDHATRTLSIIGWSLPTFWLGIILLSVFYVGFQAFPPRRLSPTTYNFVSMSGSYVRYTGLYTIDGLLNGQLWITLEALEHLVLPVLTLTIVIVTIIIRVMRSSMLEALNKGYIIAARAKGLTQNEVINKHARRNALIPTVTISGLLVAGLLNGVVITETIFSLNGIGMWAAAAALQMDIAGVLGFTLFSGFLFVMANLIVDILYAYLDPRIMLA